MDIGEEIQRRVDEDRVNRERIADIIADALRDQTDKFSNVTILDEDRVTVLVEFKSECYSIEVYTA